MASVMNLVYRATHIMASLVALFYAFLLNIGVDAVAIMPGGRVLTAIFSLIIILVAVISIVGEALSCK